MTGFTASPGRLMPDLTPRQELALLARALWREGYDDHLAGHITANLGDGTLLCNPWLLTWAEVRPEHVLRIHPGRATWSRACGRSPLGIPLHLELHRRRPRHRLGRPQPSSVPARSGRILAEVPPILDQSSALGGGRLVPWSTSTPGRVNDPGSPPGWAIEAMGDASEALLVGHGVFVLGRSARAVHQPAAGVF